MKKIILLLFSLTLILLTACGESASDSADILTFDFPPGIYQSRFPVTVSCSEEDLEIRFTYDSSIPTANSELLPEEGYMLAYRGGGRNDPSSVNIIRCAAFDKDGNQVGKSITGTYILADLPETRYSTLIVSLVCDPDDLYGYERGILVPGKIRDDFRKNRPTSWFNESAEDANFFQSGIEWERPGHIEIYNPDGDCLLAQNVGVRVSGGYNRSTELKSLRVFARYEYDDSNVMSFDAYPGLVSNTQVAVNDFKTLILRTGSNNSYNTVIQTPFLMELARDLELDVMNYRPICVYLNGKYYGFMALTEDYSPTYFETKYNIPEEYITCINGTSKIEQTPIVWELDNGIESDLIEYTRVSNYIIYEDMRDPECYENAKKMIDIDSFIKYACFQGYISNCDWPQNNVRIWRYNGGVNADRTEAIVEDPDATAENQDVTDENSEESESEAKAEPILTNGIPGGDPAAAGYDERGYNPNATEYGFDGRWRFLLKDLDLSCGFGDWVENSLFMRLDTDDGILRLNAMFQSLFKNTEFKNKVYACLCDLLSTTMQIDNVMEKIGEVEASALIEMRYFAPSYGTGGGSSEAWHNHLKTPVNFFIRRHTVVRSEIQKKYDSVYSKFKVEIEGEGTLNLNTLKLNENTALEYLIGLKLPVSVTPAKGWRLASLTLNNSKVDSESISVNSRDMTLKVTFEPDPEYTGPAAGVFFNELKYNHSRYDTSADLIELKNTSDEPIYLKGWRFVKEGYNNEGLFDTDELTLPAVTLAPGEFLVISCARNNSTTLFSTPGVKHYGADFGIEIGDKLTLIDRMGLVKDSLTLPSCNNFVSMTKIDEDWVFETEDSFGAENKKSEGYVLADLIDDRARGVYIHNGRFYEDFAVDKAGMLVITEQMIVKCFGRDSFDDHKKEFTRLNGGYDLDTVLEALRYRKFYIPSLDSYVLFSK